MSDSGPKINPRDLDNYITGHYGEDQFKNSPEEDYNVEDPKEENYEVIMTSGAPQNYVEELEAVIERQKKRIESLENFVTDVRDAPSFQIADWIFRDAEQLMPK